MDEYINISSDKKYISVLEQCINMTSNALSHTLFIPLQEQNNTWKKLLEQGGVVSESEKEGVLSSLYNQHVHTMSVTSDLLDYVRLHSQTRKLKKIDCEQLVSAVLERFKDVILANHITLCRYTPLPQVMYKEARLKRVFTCLIDNAIRFNLSPNPEISISAESHNEYWVFSIKDNGIPIPKELHSQIFMLFQKSPNTLDSKGNGVGLAFCQQIVSFYGGEIWIESNEQGNNFCFTIPKDLTS